MKKLIEKLDKHFPYLFFTFLLATFIGTSIRTLIKMGEINAKSFYESWSLCIFILSLLLIIILTKESHNQKKK